MTDILWEDDIFLGYSDCETCGVNFEGVEVFAYTNGTYYVIVSVGCYGGESQGRLSPADARDLLANWTHLDPRVQKLIDRIA